MDTDATAQVMNAPPRETPYPFPVAKMRWVQLDHFSVDAEIPGFDMSPYDRESEWLVKECDKRI